MAVKFKDLGTLNRAKLERMAQQINLKVAAPMILKFVQKNFQKGGRPKKFDPNSAMTLWSKRLAGFGNKPLVASGNLWNKAINNPVVKATSSEVILKTRNPTNVIKASEDILHDGGTVTQTITKKQKRFFWAMHFIAEDQGNDAIAGRWLGMALAPVGATFSFTIPARPWTQLTRSQSDSVRRAVEREWRAVIERFAKTGKMNFLALIPLAKRSRG